MKGFRLRQGQLWFIGFVGLYFLTKQLTKTSDKSTIITMSVIALYIIITFALNYHKVIGELGVFFHAAGRGDLSRKLLEIAVNGGESTKRSPMALNLYAIQKLQDGEPDTAISYFQKAKEQNRNPVLDKHIEMGIGSSYWVKKDIPKAIEIFENLKNRYDYVNPDVYTTLGYLYFLNNDDETAKNYSEKAIADKPNHAPAYDNLGQILYKEGKTEEAEAYFLKAIQYNSGMTDSLYYLAEISAAKGDKEAAGKYITTAYNQGVNALNTITKEQLEAAYQSLK